MADNAVNYTYANRSRSATGTNSGTATLYGDSTWAQLRVSPLNGTNTFGAVAQDSYGRTDSNSVTAFLPLTNSYTYNLNGNLLSDFGADAQGSPGEGGAGVVAAARHHGIVAWLAEHLAMGHFTRVSRAVNQVKRRPEREQAQLKRRLSELADD